MTTVATSGQERAGHRTVHSVQGGGGLRLHVCEWGNQDGPPILFIHGWSQNQLCWARQYESELAEEFRLVAFDLRGHGMSEAPPSASTTSTGSSGRTTWRRSSSSWSWSGRCSWAGRTAPS